MSSKNKSQKIYLTEEENLFHKEKAEKLGLSISEYFKYCAENHIEVVLPVKDLQEYSKMIDILSERLESLEQTIIRLDKVYDADIKRINDIMNTINETTEKIVKEEYSEREKGYGRIRKYIERKLK